MATRDVTSTVSIHLTTAVWKRQKHLKRRGPIHAELSDSAETVSNAIVSSTYDGYPVHRNMSVRATST